MNLKASDWIWTLLSGLVVGWSPHTSSHVGPSILAGVIASCITLYCRGVRRRNAGAPQQPVFGCPPALFWICLAIFALLWAWMFKKAPNPFFERLIRAGILGFPFLFAIADWLENAGFLFVIFSYPEEYPGVASFAGTLKGTKPLIELLILIFTVAFAAVTIRQSRAKD